MSDVKTGCNDKSVKRTLAQFNSMVNHILLAVLTTAPMVTHTALISMSKNLLSNCQRLDADWILFGMVIIKSFHSIGRNILVLHSTSELVTLEAIMKQELWSVPQQILLMTQITIKNILIDDAGLLNILPLMI